MDTTGKRDNHTPERGKGGTGMLLAPKQPRSLTLECSSSINGDTDRTVHSHVRCVKDERPPAVRQTTRKPKRSASDAALDEPDAHRNGLASPSTNAETRQNSSRESATQQSVPKTARLLSDGGGYRYVNNHLWNSLSTPGATSSPTVTNSEAGTPNGRSEATQANPNGRSGDSIYENAVQMGAEVNTGRSFLFNDQQGETGPSPADTSASLALQPQPAQIVHLWQTYLTNVDPIMKVFHAPTVQQLVLGQIGQTNPSASERALVSSIYLISTVSLTDIECVTIFQRPRSAMLVKFRRSTEDAMSAAGFVTTTSLVVLCAMVLYLASLRSLGELQTVWSLTGLAIRIGGTIGLARDGSVLDLPPFECEMRRRLWWALIYLDARTAELVGQDGDLLVQKYDARIPSNLNDSELYPTMSRLPDDRLAATEMVYVQLRATIGKRLRALPGATGPASTWQRMRSANIPMSDKVEALSGLEKQLHDDVIQYCDPSVPLQYLTMNSAESIMTKMRLVANIPIVAERTHREAEAELSENVYELSLRLINQQLDLWTEPGVQKWRWHWQGQFQWYGLACLIRQTRLRKDAPDAMRGWNVIRRVFDIIIPSLALGPKSPLLGAIQGLLITATGSHDHGRNHPSTSARTGVMASSPATSEATPHQCRYGFSTGRGSKPHSAMLPGIDSIQTDPAEAHDTPLHQELDDSTNGFDFNSIDWDEFDRLTNELCRP